ncbi:MAG TPA: phenylalanine--tRNA ligase subunit beta, partial [Geobacteraceae bacterium]|nr:phenylalanine--tRNA ligase subunit beta [Geobacteraceae bacterium]
RVDIEREIDLVEEVARLHGFENIPMTMPVAEVISDRIPRSQALEREVKNLLALEGFNEVINFSFASYNDIRKLNLHESDRRSSAVSLLNPLVDEHAVMRTTLLPALLQTTARNFSLRNFNLRLFEMRRVYLAKPGSELPDEPLHVAGVLTGLRNPEGWNQSRDSVDFYDVKGLIESIKVLFKLPELTFVQGGVEPFYHPGKSAAILCRDTVLGTLGEIHPDVQESFEIDKPVLYFELDFARLVSLSSAVLPVTPPSRFPDSYRDIAMLIDAETPSSAVVECIKGVKSDKTRSVEIFDLYTGDRIPEGQKSLAVRVRYGSFDRTLTDDEVGKVHDKIVNTLISTLGIAIR